MATLRTGSRIGSYEVLAPLGAGGMGEVYRARDTKLKRDVAIKVLPAEWSQDPERLARAQREAEVLASLNHPHRGSPRDRATDCDRFRSGSRTGNRPSRPEACQRQDHHAGASESSRFRS